MRSTRENMWSADAEMCMQGFVVPIMDELHAQYVVDYILHTMFPEMENTQEKAVEFVETAKLRYASQKPREVKYITLSTSPFGRLMTFVVDKKKLVKANGDMTSTGNLCWVENLDAPDCSELGYCFFVKRNGKLVRYA